MDIREEFERLPSIKVFLPNFEFNEEINEYVRSGSYHQPEYSLGFFNGAWYAFQEQQKKIDGAIKYLSRGGYTPNWLVKELLK